jgi:hypothetical protein
LGEQRVGAAQLVPQSASLGMIRVLSDAELAELDLATDDALGHADPE